MLKKVFASVTAQKQPQQKFLQNGDRKQLHKKTQGALILATSVLFWM